MPKSTSWLSKLFGGSDRPADRRRERQEPGSAARSPDVGNNWGDLPEAPADIRDLKWSEPPLRAHPAAQPGAVEIAQPNAMDPSMGLRKKQQLLDQPVAVNEEAEIAEAPEALDALHTHSAVELPLDVASLDSDAVDGRVFEHETQTHDPRLDQALYEAARAGRVDEALALIDQGANPHALPGESARDRRSLPLIAAVLPDLRLLRSLIAHGANLNDSSLGMTPLLAACRDSWHGRPDAVMTLIANGSDVRRTDADGNTPLHHAARSSDPGVAAMLIDAAADLNALNSVGQTPVGMAMESGNFRLAKFLLEKGARAEPIGGRPALIDAAANDDDDVGGVQLLLRQKVKVNATDIEGRSALHHAAAHGNPDIIDLLLEAGGNASLRDDAGMTPLLLAAANGKVLSFRRLARQLDAARAVDWDQDAQGNSALHLAVLHENSTAELIRELMTAGVDPSATDANGHTAVDLAARQGRWKLIEALDPEYVIPSSLRDADGDGSAADAAPIALLRDALDQGREQQHQDLIPLLTARDLGLLMHQVDAIPTPHRLQWLLRHGADVQVPDMHGDTLMFYLLDRMPASNDSVELLLNAGVSPAGRGGFARFLHACVQSKSKPVWTAEIAQQMQRRALDLLDRGADPFGRDVAGHAPLDHAIALDFPQVTARLLQIGIDPNTVTARGLTPLHVATDLGDVELVKSLLKAGASPHALATDGQAPLGIALAAGRDELAQWLDWRKWSFPNRPLRDSDLPAAAMVGDWGAVNRLLDLGFDVNAQDDRSCTALLRAAGGGHRKVVQLLLQKGANPQIAATSGATPLSAAASMRQLEILDELIAAGAKVDKLLPGELSVLSLSAALGLPDVVERLIDAGADMGQIDARGRTALHCAAMQGFSATDAGRVVTLLRTILAKGGATYINADASGATPLLMLLGSAAEPGTQAHEPVIIAASEELLGAGASLDARDPRGFTPLHLAALHGLSSVVQRLLLAGSDPEARDSLNRRPQELALMRGYIDISSELEAHSHTGTADVSIANLLRSRE